MSETKTMNVADVVYREDLYPRINGGDPKQVDLYQQAVDQLPPIEVNQHNVLIDGWHRWTAHREAKRETIEAVVTHTESEDELYFLSAERNAHHGLQLSMADKRKMAGQMYARSNERMTDAEIAKRLKVSKRTVSGWLAGAKKTAKKEREAKIKAMWLRCHTQQEIADAMETDKASVSREIDEMLQKGKFANLQQFDPILYNIYTAAKLSDDNTHFGHTNSAIVENLIYGTKMDVGDIVVDPFAGSGSTLDVCAKYGIRCWLGDRAPTPKHEKNIRRHDIVVDGIPRLSWKDVKLVYLDPPYWMQAKGKYSDDAEDLANMDADAFHDSLVGVIKGFAKKIKQAGGSAHIALIVSPTQWPAPNKETVDHAFEVARRLSLPLVERISCPYSTQQYYPAQVEWAKENRKRLVLTRETWVWRV